MVGHSQAASAPARLSGLTSLMLGLGSGGGGVPSGSLPGRSAWLPGSEVPLV